MTLKTLKNVNFQIFKLFKTTHFIINRAWLTGRLTKTPFGSKSTQLIIEIIRI